MEIRRELAPMPLKQIKTFLLVGIVICALLIIMSVDYLFNRGKYVELAITTVIFIGFLIIIRKMNT